MRAEERGGQSAGKHTALAPASGRRRTGTARRRVTDSRRTRLSSLWAAVLGFLGFGASGRRAVKRSGRVRRVTGLVVACVLTAAALAPVDVAPASAAAALQALKSGTLSAARDAAAANTRPVTEARAEVQDDQGAKKGQEALGSGKAHPDQGTVVKAEKANASIAFSGHKVASDLDVSVKELADGAARTAASETGGTVLGTPVQVTATDTSGKGVTAFPADPVIVKHENGPSTVKDVNPGVTLELGGIDTSRLGKEKGKLDPSTVHLYTRENPGDPWTMLPSYFDAKTRTVKAESTHLSQFAVIGTPFVPPAGPVIVLDPDDDVAHTTGPNGAMTELPESYQLAQALQTAMATQCKATVLITPRTAAVPVVSASLRAGFAAAANPDVTVTLAFDALYGHPWGVSTDGGTRVYSRGQGPDNALTGSLVGQMPGYTGRPANTATQSGLPYAEFASVPGALVHMETLYIDHNYDRPVIDNGFSHIVDGVFTGIGTYLQSVPGKQFSCTNPVTGGWPTKPSAAELAKWRNLGFHNYQAYGAEPVSFATGNLIEQYKLFTLAGPGTGTDMSLVYNSQDGRLSRTGAGVSFGLGARAQRFSDGSVLAVGGDGASYVFTGNGAVGYTPDPGDPDTLTEAGGGKLALASPQGEKWVFDAAGIEGIGDLVSHTDRAGNTTTLTYTAPGPNAQFKPLASITDAAGQTIRTGSDNLGRVTSFTLPDGRVWRLAYDGAGNLTSITDASGGVRAFTYDGNHRLLTATDPLGVTYLRNTYDASGRVVKQLDAQNNVRTFAYDDGAGTTTYTDNEGHATVYTHDGAGHVTAMKDANGGVRKFAYDGADHVTSSTDPSGNTTSYAYDGSGRLTKSTGPAGDVRSYTYTPAGDLATVTDLGGPGGGSAGTTRTTSFDIGAQGLPTAVHQPDGTVLTRSYDARGKLTSSKDGNGNTTSYAYDAAGNLSSSTDPTGAKTSYVYDAGNHVVALTDPNGNTTKYAWDALDHPVKRTDPAGGVTSLAYDGNGHLTTMTDPTGAKSSYAWDALFRLSTVTDPTGAVTKYSYNREDKLIGVTDPLGAVTAHEVDALGRVVKTTDPNGGNWLSSWNPTGTLASSTDPTGAKTSYGYDAAEHPVTATGPTGAVTKYSYDPVGKILTSTDPTGAVKSTAYDAMDRVVTLTDQTGAKTSYTYDAAGNRVKVTDRRGQAWLTSYDKDNRTVTSTDPTGAKTGFAYDADGNRTTVTDPLGRKTATAYDALNRPVTVTDPTGAKTTTAYDAVGRVLASTNPDGNTTENSYTARGQLATVTDPTGATTSYAYDAAGHRTGTLNPDKVTTAYGYDPAGQLTTVIENAKAGQPATTDTNVTTKYAYTPAGHLATMTDPNGHATKYDYDPRGLLAKETNPLGNTKSYEYDPRGLLTKSTDGNALATGYGYTARGQLATTTYANGKSIKYGYDTAGALTTMEDPTGATGFSYTPRGQLATQTDTRSKTINYTYDAARELTSLALPQDQAISYSYDGAGRPATEATPAGTLAYAYTPAGLPTTTTRSSGITTSYTHDADGRTTGITHTTAPAAAAAAAAPAGAPTAPAGTDAVSCTTVTAYLNNRTLPPAAGGLPAGASITFNYAYDPAGNVTNRTRTTTGTPTPSTGTPEQPAVVPGTTPGTTDNRAYNYDPLNRLVKSASTTGATATYGYDPAGNRTAYATTDNPGTTTGGDPLTVNAGYNAANQLTTETSTTAGSAPQAVTYSYDGNGNRTKRATLGIPDTTNTYTPTNQPATTTQPGYATTRSYDGLGRATGLDQTTKTGTQHTDTLYNGLTPIQSTQNGATTTFAPDSHGNTATTTTVNGGTTTSTWSVQDRLGSTIATTNPQTGTPTGPGADATLAQLADYTDTGTPQYATTGWNTGAVTGGYTGQGTDPTAGLTTFHARNYDPATATFTGHDTWGGRLRAPQTLNHYAYTLNDPATLKDHLGNDPIEADGTDWNSVSPESLGYQDNWMPNSKESADYNDPVTYYTPAPAPSYPDVNGGDGGYIAPQPATTMQKFINNTIQTPAQTSPAQPQERHDDGWGWLPGNWSEETWKVVATIGLVVGGVALAATGVGLVVELAAGGAVLAGTAATVASVAGTTALAAGAGSAALDGVACVWHHKTPGEIDTSSCVGAATGFVSGGLGAVSKFGSAAVAGEEGYRAGWDLGGALFGSGGYAIDANSYFQP